MSAIISFGVFFVLFLVIPIAVIYSYIFVFMYIKNLSYKSVLGKYIVLILLGVVVVVCSLLSIFGIASLFLIFFTSFYLDSYLIGGGAIFLTVGLSLAIIGIVVVFRYRMHRIKMSPPKEDYKNEVWLKSQYHEKGIGVRDIAIDQNVSMVEIEKAVGKFESSSKED